MTDQETAGLKDRCRRVFAALDRDGRGTISRAEILPALQLLQLNPTEDEVRLFLRQFEREKNAGFTFAQFEEFVLQEVRPLSQEEMKQDLRRAFALFDQSNSGYVHSDDFRSILTKYGNMRLSDTEADAILEMLDTRKDGRISIAELECLLITDAEESLLVADQKWDIV